MIAAEGATGKLLKNEFPCLMFLPLVGYRVKYSRKKQNLAFRLFLQLPRIILTIAREHIWIKKIVHEYSVDLVISDNRFGLYHKNIPSIYITHQLLIKSSNGITEKLAQHIHYWFIKKFTSCWVPDSRENGLAGQLSHPKKIPRNVEYIGPISRFTLEPDIAPPIRGKPFLYDLMITLSGPEPQRTIFENLLLKDLHSYDGKVLFIRGLPGVVTLPVSQNPGVHFRNHLDASEMNLAIVQSAIVISRSGYTTIMDLVKLHKKAILVPTPGQTEQEYLAEYLYNKNMFYSIAQENFSLETVLGSAEQFPFAIHNIDMELYKNIIAEIYRHCIHRA